MKTLQLCRESIKKKLSVLEAFAPGELSQEVFANLSEQVASEIGWNISEVLEQLGSAWLWSSRRGYDGNIRPWEAHLSFATSMASSPLCVTQSHLD
jgi:hypothetical protein